MPLQVVETNSGLVEGIPCGNPDYTVFKGIPYARAPIGEYRWRPPVDCEKWEGVRKCDTFGPIAIQRRPQSGEFYQKEFFPVHPPMSEDCLYLNIWTPASRVDEALPVMVWIHGGAYINGFGHEMEFDGEAFCKRGVILVTINYRLGLFGYFAHPELSQSSEHGVSGNYGLLDQIHALCWIQNNIHAFGGNPSNVTVFGQSAGGGSVQAIVSSELAQGMVQRAVVQSAGGIDAHREPYTLSDAEAFGETFVKILGKPLKECKAMPAERLNQSFWQAAESGKLGGWPWFMPNVDGYVLHDTPGRIIAAGQHLDIPYMIGSVPEDGRLFGGKPADGPQQKRANAMIGPRFWARSHLHHHRAPVYIYYFDREMPGGDDAGAFHSSELWYVFGTISRCWRPLTGADYDLSLAMVDYWTTFAKHGDPNGSGLPAWPPFTQDYPVTMQFNERHMEAVDMGGDKVLQDMELAALKRLLQAWG